MKDLDKKKGIDFDEMFFFRSENFINTCHIGLAASMDLEIEQLDVKTAFLHGDLEK